MLNTFPELQENFQLCYVINLLPGEYHQPPDVNRMFLNVRSVLFLCFQKESSPSSLVRDCEVALSGSSHLAPSCPPSRVDIVRSCTQMLLNFFGPSSFLPSA